MAEHTETTGMAPFGLLARFDEADELVAATKKARDEGYRRMEAYTPFPVPDLNEPLGYRWNAVALITLVAGLAGAAGGFLLQYGTMVIDYPMNVGGRPDLSWPTYVPITFESGILVAAFGATLGMLGLNGLPRPHHPVFSASSFDRVSRDSFYLCIEADDNQFDPEKTRAFLEENGAREVELVEQEPDEE
jgi:hypothetical protein